MKVEAYIPKLEAGTEEYFNAWAKHLDIKVVPMKHDTKLICDSPGQLFWLGMNVGSGLLPPNDQTRQSNSEFIKKFY